MANQIVLVPQKLLENPPSVREGLSHAVEQQQRIYGCHLIQKAGVLLKLEAVSIASAQTILHRFFFRRSLKQFDVRRVATASLLLACKLEEDPRRVMHLIGVIWLLSQLEDQPNMQLKEETLDNFIIDFDSQDYELFRMDVFRCERYILRELGFMVSQTLVHPHRYILQYIHALFKDNFLFTNQLSQKAWGYLNDSMRTTLCCEVQPAVIAVGSIFLAACDLGIPLPREMGWYELFDVSWDDVIKVCSTILSLYTLPLPSYLKLADETRSMQKAPHYSGSAAASTVKGAPARNSTSSETRTTQSKDELAKGVAAEGSASLTSGEGYQLPGSSSSSTGKNLFTSQSGFAEGDSAGVRELSSADPSGPSHSGKESPSSITRAPGDAFKEPAHSSKPGLQKTSAAIDRRISEEELLNRPAARFSRAQPRAPPPLKERGQMTGRSQQDVQVTSSGRGVPGSPSCGSSLSSCRRGDMQTSSSSQSNMSCSSGNAPGSGSSSSAGSGSSGGHAVGAADPFPGTRLKYIHFPSSRVSPSSDKAMRPGSTGALVRRSSPRRTDDRDSEPSVRHDSTLSPTPFSARSFDREGWSRGRQEREIAASYRGSTSGIQAPCRFVTAGNTAGDPESPATKVNESSHCRLSQRSGSVSSSKRSRTGWTGGSYAQEGLPESRESTNLAGRLDGSRKSGENIAVSRTVTAAAGILHTRCKMPLLPQRDKDNNDPLRVSSGWTGSPQHPGSLHWQRSSRTSRSENNSSALAARSISAACGTSARDEEESCADGFGEKRQRSPSPSSRCFESLEGSAVIAGERERRSMKRQRRLPPQS